MKHPTTLPVRDIKVGKRIRKEVGDLASLAESIRVRGMLHPVVISPDHRLIAGLRRLKAAKQLGMETVPVRVAENLKEVEDLYRAEAEENTCRLDFTPAEGATYRRQLMEWERPAAEERQEEGRKKGGEKAGRGRPAKQVPSKLDGTNGQVDENRNKASRRASVPTGYSATTLDKVDEIKEHAEAEPEKYGDLYEKAQKPGARVDGLHKEMKKRADPPVPKAAPRYPHSDQLVKWLRFVSGETHVINVDMGGIGALLAEPGKWDWREVREFVLPMLEALGTTIGEFFKEIQSHADQQRSR